MPAPTYCNRRHIAIEHLERRRMLALEPEMVLNPETGQPFLIDSPPIALNSFAYFEAEGSMWGLDGSDSGATRLLPEQYTLRGGLVPFKEMHIFVASRNDPLATLSLWATDGTSEGTVKLFDFEGLEVHNSYFRPWQDKLLFNASTAEYGEELWITDGTEDGTVMLRDIYLGPHDAGVSGGWEWKKLFFFVADDGLHGPELWQTDGTMAGTTLVADVNPGSAGSNPSVYLSSDGQTSNSLLFVADDGEHGRELWVTDGMTTGTKLLADINPGSASGFFGATASRSVLLGDHDYFIANDGQHGSNVWATDGTEQGTHQITDLKLEGDSSVFSVAPAGENELFISINDDRNSYFDVWIINRISGDATPLIAFDYAEAGVHPFVAARLSTMQELANGSMVFQVTDPELGTEYWTTNGTALGTQLLVDIATGQADGASIDPVLTVYGHALFFAADKGFNGPYESAQVSLWRTDGTAEGTAIVWARFSGFQDGGFGHLNVRASHLRRTIYVSAFMQEGDRFGPRPLWQLTPPAGDANFDGLVDLSDFSLLKRDFGVAGPNVAGDLNYDDVVNLVDFGILKENFGNAAEQAVVGAERSPPDEIAFAVAINTLLEEEDSV